eukprot:gene13281-3880_t
MTKHALEEDTEGDPRSKMRKTVLLVEMLLVEGDTWLPTLLSQHRVQSIDGQ